MTCDSVYGYCRTKLYAYPPSVVVFQVMLMMWMLDAVDVEHFDALSHDLSFRGWD